MGVAGELGWLGEPVDGTIVLADTGLGRYFELLILAIVVGPVFVVFQAVGWFVRSMCYIRKLRNRHPEVYTLWQDVPEYPLDR